MSDDLCMGEAPQRKLAHANSPFATELLAALGIAPKTGHGVTKVMIELESQQLAIVTIERTLFEDEGEKVTKLLDRYNLTPKED